MKRYAWIIPLVLGLLFVLAGSAFIPLLGIQNDEVYFAGGMYQPYEYRYGIHLFGHRVPLMLLSYLGATKTWFYKGLFAVWPESLDSLRIPMLAAGGLAIWLFWLLLRRIAGLRAAVAGAALLASDALFLLVTLWAPAISYHLLLLAALLFFLRYHRTKSAAALAAAFFFLGLGLWDKALFLWTLAALAAAALAAFPRKVLRAITPRNAAVAAFAFAAGAAPLLLFNIVSRGETIRGNSSFTLSELPVKARILRLSLDGSVLFGWLVNRPDPQHTREPIDAFERASLRLAGAGIVGERSLAFAGYALAVLLLPLVWRTRARAPAVFALVFIAVAWIQMAVTRNAGGAAHHTILLWPMPQLFAAVTLAEASRRIGKAGIPALAAVVLLVAGSNALLVNRYFAQMVRYCPALNWTDAVYPMVETVAGMRPTRVFLADWGMADTMRFLGAGTFPLFIATDPLVNPDAAQARAAIQPWVSTPDHVFVTHTAKAEFIPGSRARLRELAASLGYEPYDVRVVKDECGRPMFDVFRFKRTAR